MKRKIRKMKWIALLMAAALVLTTSQSGLVAVLAEEDGTTENVTETACTLTEGCTLESGHEGDCVVEEASGNEEEETVNGEETGASVAEEEAEDITLESVQALIDLLPDESEITSENAETVGTQLDAIDAAKNELYEAGGDVDSLDMTKYDAACAALVVFEGEVSVSTASTVEVTAAANWTGQGTAADPYQIATSDDLALLATNVNSSETAENYIDTYFILTADITVTDWTPIGFLNGSDTTTARAFCGTFDGGGHTITLSGSNGLLGLIAYATIQNLTLNVNINNTTDITGSPTGNGVAGLAVVALYQADITSVTVKGSIIANYSDQDGYADAAGFVNRAGKGLALTLNFTNCSNEATVVAHDRKAAGYVVSMNAGATVNIVNCTNSGQIEAYQNTYSSSEMYAGGFVAWNSGTLNVTNSSNSGYIYAYRTVDGSSTVAVGGISANAWGNGSCPDIYQCHEYGDSGGGQCRRCNK